MPQIGSLATGPKMPWLAAFMRLSESMRNVPEITIRSPAMSPLLISTWSPSRQPVSTDRGSKYPSPRSTNTVLRSPESTIASAGTASDGGSSMSKWTSTNIPGLSASPGLSVSSLTFSVRVASSKIGSVRLTVASSRRSWSSETMRAFDPARMKGAWFSYTSARIHTRRRSAMR